YCRGHVRDLPSFPTRRSSDLAWTARGGCSSMRTAKVPSPGGAWTVAAHPRLGPRCGPTCRRKPRSSCPTTSSRTSRKRRRSAACGWRGGVPLVFDPGQPHQRRAIEAIVASLEGQGPAAGRHADHVGGRVVHGNRLPWSYEALEQRVRAHQAREGLDVEGAAWMRDPTDPSAVPFPTLSVEMETGTGKTYVFLRTALELATRVGWRKFVVVVPSVAIREGVLATLRATRSHFAALYPDVPYRFFAYERERMHAVLRFAESPDVELAVLTIDAFNRERNVFRRPHDRCGGASPMQWWQAIHPVLLVDEAHHVETPLRIRAVAELQPCCALRYGATHRRRAGLVHRLS